MSLLDEKKVVLGMSGGVDSSVAAALLKEEGYQVVGLSMILYSCEKAYSKGCCTPVDRLDARSVCEKLGIPFEIIDLREIFKRKVVDYFAKEYSLGRTPLPCAPCNSLVRFKALLDYADSVGAKWIATGHYACVEENREGIFELKRAEDLKKDQSYFLWGLSQKELSRLKLPIGNYRKEETRDIAREKNLLTSEKKDSQDLCFVGDENHAAFLEEHFPEKAFPEGNFVDASGEIVGKHLGLHHYTIGQRRGLGVSFGERRYVALLDPQKNEIVLGKKESLKAKGLVAKEMHWMHPRFSEEKEGLFVKIRSAHVGVSARWEKKAEEMRIYFGTSQFAITPGQAVVLYKGDVCLGGGWIERGIA